MNVLMTLLGALPRQTPSDPTNPPPSTPSNDAVDVLRTVTTTGPNFVAVWPLVGIFATLFGIVLALIFFGGLKSSMTGGVKFAWSGGNEKASAAGRKSLAFGGGVMAFVIFFAIIGGIALTLVTAF